MSSQCGGGGDSWVPFSSYQSSHLANSRPMRDPVSRKRKGERHRRKDTKVILQPLHTCADALMNTLTGHSWIHTHMENVMNATHSRARWPGLCGHSHGSSFALEGVLLSLPHPPFPKQVCFLLSPYCGTMTAPDKIVTAVMFPFFPSPVAFGPCTLLRPLYLPLLSRPSHVCLEVLNLHSLWSVVGSTSTQAGLRYSKDRPLCLSLCLSDF